MRKSRSCRIRFVIFWIVALTIVSQIFFQWRMNHRHSTPTDNGITPVSSKKPVEMRRKSYSLTLAVGAHPGTVLPASDFIRNLVRALTSGRDSCTISRVLVFYDARKRGPVLNAFLQDLQELLRDQVVHKLIRLRWNHTLMKDVFGVDDAQHDDGPMYATYQFLTQECFTEYCMLANLDIFAHEGGGIRHAIKALRRHPSAVFAIPPLADSFVDYSQSDDLIKLFPDADGNFPYFQEIGQLRKTPESGEPNCRAPWGGFSSRYWVADRKRFLRALPLPISTSQSPFLEEHPAIFRERLCLNSKSCRNGAGWLVHPPPWHMGNRLLKKCGIEALQKAVDDPDGLVVDSYNNMIEDNWTAACLKYL